MPLPHSTSTSRATRGHQSRCARVAWAAIRALLCLAALSCANRNDPLHDVAARIQSAGNPDSTSVVVVFDDKRYRYLKSHLSRRFHVVHFQYAEVPERRMYVPNGLLEQFRLTRETWNRPDLWVLETDTMPSDWRKGRFAVDVASRDRDCVLRDTVETAQGRMVLTKWVRQAGAAKDLAAIAWREAYVESMYTAPPLEQPFSPADLRVDHDSLVFYLAKLSDKKYYWIGGCPDGQLDLYIASEKLAEMGPGVVPFLVERIDDPDPFVRERVCDALNTVTQDQRVMSPTAGDYLLGGGSTEVVQAWWRKYRHFWVREIRPIDRK